jgi:hypothetical protein
LDMSDICLVAIPYGTNGRAGCALARGAGGKTAEAGFRMTRRREERRPLPR